MKRVLDAIVLVGLMTVVIMASGCRGTVLVPIYKDGTMGLALAGGGVQPQVGKEVVAFVPQPAPLTPGEKWLRAGGVLAGAIGVGLVGNNNDWFVHKDSDHKDQPAQQQTYTIDARQVTIQNQAGGGGTQNSSQEWSGE